MKSNVPPRRIVHVTEVAGGGVLAFLLQATRELAETGVKQTLLYSRGADTPAGLAAMFHPSVDLVELPLPAGGYLRYLRQLREALLLESEWLDDTVVHLHSARAGFLGRLALVGLRRRPRVLYSPHGLSFLDPGRWLRSAACYALEWLAARVPATLVACSRGEAQELASLARTPVRLLESAVDDSFFDLKRRRSHTPRVVCMGRLSRQKAPERFASLAVRFQIAGVPARFVWIGDGDARSAEMLRAAGVKVTGWLPPEQVKRQLAKATVYVQPSRWEGMPISVLQALASAVPCVVTDVVGNRDAVRQGLTGYVVASQEEMLMAVRRLLQDLPLRERFAQAARRDARERFGSVSFRMRLCQLYGLPVPLPVLDQPIELPERVLAFTRPAPKAAAGREQPRSGPLPLQA